MTHHDFNTDGSRTIKRIRRGPVAGWIEESAAYHCYGSSHYGADAWTTPDGVTLTINVGRWSASLDIRVRATP